MQRHAQVVYPKDLAVILLWADIFPGAKVIEGGLGSGGLTMALLRAVGPTGTVSSYEHRQEAANRAMKNVIALLGPVPNHQAHIADIYEAITETEVDRVVLDVPEPWAAIRSAAYALKPGGIFSAYVPTVIQLQRCALALERSPCFALVKSMETLIRPWHVTKKSVRPEHRMVGHTGFIIFAKRNAVTANLEPDQSEDSMSTEPPADPV
jgi:tRNA (adenine57-N1/adenine58-N1)-methyltransferase